MPKLSKLIVATLVSLSALHIHAETKQTRYGTFEIKRTAEFESEFLYFNNKLVQPPIEGNNGLSFEGQFKLQHDDVVLVQDIGGSGCPAQFYFIKVASDKKPHASPMFGTCSDLADIKIANQLITIKMPEFMPLHLEAEQAQPFKPKIVTYTYDGKVVRENGKIIKVEQ